MKITTLAAASLAAAVALAGAADAQVVHRSTTVTERTVTHTGPIHRTRRVCSVRYMHHRKVRTCRTVTY